MAYILGNTTLKNPTTFERETIEVSGVNLSLTGRTTKDIRTRKERFVLTFKYLTQAQTAAIYAEYDLLTTRNFQVTETNLTIGPVEVHIEIPGRDYLRGADYRADMVLILTEVI